MTARAFNFWPFHRHDFGEYVSRTLDGATLGWGMKPEPCYSITYRCKCGKQRTTSGWLLPLVKFKTDTDGWPLTDEGKRMEIAK